MQDFKFPWKDNLPPLPTNYTECERRTQSMVCRLADTPDFLIKYGKIITEQETRGFIENVYDEQPTDSAHYITHLPVKKDKPTTPIRIVYDCSFHSSIDSPSLKDCLLAGPPFLKARAQLSFSTAPLLTDCQQISKRPFFLLDLVKRGRDFSRFCSISNPKDRKSTFQN